uniref:Major facilitator superfamily (MFS) profile domain-containing protein n=1 Tax=Acrobeloides nanus TaxID=290746 RepID=A0A914DPL7_9BILA
MKFEDLIEYIGEFGTYQKIQFVLVCLPTIFTALHSLSWTFTAVDLPHRCRLPDVLDKTYWLSENISYQDVFNHTECDLSDNPRSSDCSYESCKYVESVSSCPNGYVFDFSQVKYSAINRWEIVCDRQFLKAVVQSTYYIGQLTGSIIFGILGDRIGRKKVFFMAILVQIVSGLGMIVAPSWQLFSIFRLGAGFAHPGIFMIAVVMGMELVGPSKRKIAPVITGMFFSFGEMILAIMAYFIRDYRVLQAAIAIPSMILISYWMLIPESARWLVSQKRYAEADKILQRAAKINKSRLPDRWWECIELSSQQKQSPGKLNLFDLVLIVYFFIDRIGRKPLLAGGYTVAAICMLSNLLIGDNIHWSIAFVQFLLAKTAITVVYDGIYTFTPELFPTAIRNTAMGICSMMARVGATFTSYISMWLVEKFGKIAMILPFASLALCSAVIIMVFLPETMGLELKETIDQVEGNVFSKQEIIPLSKQTEEDSKYSQLPN